MSEQPGDRNNQLENKQHFFAIKALIGMGRLAKRRDGEEEKTSLHTDKPEIHRKAGEERSFIVREVKRFFSRTKPSHSKSTTGLFLFQEHW